MRDRAADLAILREIQDEARAGKHLRATALAESALENGLEHPLIFNLAALQQEQLGRLDAAENLLRKGVAVDPEDIGCRNALGLCLLRREKPAEALAEFDRLLTLNADLPFAHSSRGSALSWLGESAAAQLSFTRAVELDPGQVAAWTGLAVLAAARGAYAEARGFAERALALVPGFPDALIALATADYGERKYADAEARIRNVLLGGGLGPVQRHHAHGLLGDVLDALDRRPEAFAAYSACNEGLRGHYRSRYAEGSSAGAYAESIVQFFDSAEKTRWQARPAFPEDGPHGAGHVFLIGFPRSGTTLLEVVLEGHPEVVSLEEQELLIDAVREYMRRPADLAALQNASPGDLERLRAAYWRRVADFGLTVAGKTFVDKHPLNTLKLPLIARLFPRAKILFACRDPRDIIWSCYRHRFRMSAPIYELLTLDGASRYYDVTMRLGIRWMSQFGLDACLVRHEDLVTEFAREMKRVCAFLNLTWAPGMGDFALRTRDRPVLTPSTSQLVRGLNTEGIGQWRRYREFLEPVLPLLTPWVRRFYYDER
jgi:tetratricopeptide (TPR) repeat protein